MKQRKFIRLANNVLLNLSPLISFENPGENEPPEQPIQYQPDHPYLMTDPRINFIKRVLKLSLPFTTKTNPYAFRLKHLKNWLVYNCPEIFLLEMAWDCGTNCVFCYQKGNPPFMRTKIRMTKEEILTRLKYFQKGRSLVSGAPYENDEVLNNPYIIDVLRMMRSKTKELIEITTNGTALTRGFINTLKRFQPLLLFISLNSSNPNLRKQIMRDPHSEIAIESLQFLKAAKIPYIISIVPWPGLPLRDIEKTIRYAQKFSALEILIRLPSYSRYFSAKKIFDGEDHWRKTAAFISTLRRKYRIPILINPIVIEYLFDLISPPGAPIIIGAIKNSPAFKCGIKSGDTIKSINGQNVDYIEDAVELLKNNSSQTISLDLLRRKKLIHLRLKPGLGNYPFHLPEIRRDLPFGIVLRERFPLVSKDDLEDIYRFALVHDARKVLVVTSKAAYPFLKYLMKRSEPLKMPGVKIKLITAKNRYLGGNIKAANLLMVEDYIYAIKKNMKKYRPDLIILPSSPFSAWGRDMIGRINLDIERAVKIPVEFVNNQTL